MHFKRKELDKFRSLKGLLIDVRSPSEYYKGHMPNSINIPLFDNEERSIIGTIYKKHIHVFQLIFQPIFADMSLLIYQPLQIFAQLTLIEVLHN